MPFEMSTGAGREEVVQSGCEWARRWIDGQEGVLVACQTAAANPEQLIEALETSPRAQQKVARLGLTPGSNWALC